MPALTLKPSHKPVKAYYDTIQQFEPLGVTHETAFRLMREIRKTVLPDKYACELHCNEVLLLPYYVASINVEHEFNQATGAYQPFEGICLVVPSTSQKSGSYCFLSPKTPGASKNKRRRRCL